LQIGKIFLAIDQQILFAAQHIAEIENTVFIKLNIARQFHLNICQFRLRHRNRNFNCRVLLQ